jgi:hypothetical protein
MQAGGRKPIAQVEVVIREREYHAERQRRHAPPRDGGQRPSGLERIGECRGALHLVT